MTERTRLSAPPNLDVIEVAIAKLNAGLTPYCCTALTRAVDDIEDPYNWFARTNLYCTQFRKCIWGPKGTRPVWWSSPHHHYRAERIAALKKFRQACIDAAKKEQA